MPDTAKTTSGKPARGGLLAAARQAVARRHLSLPGLEPTSRLFGFDRGQPIDRYYIENFLNTHCQDVRGRVLEIADNDCTTRFGGDRVTHSEVLMATPAPNATIVGDLADGANIPDDTFDCFILTQTLLVVYDVHAALKTTHRILKPGGVVLITVPGISQISRYDADRWGDFWRFTPQCVQRLLTETFRPEDVAVTAHGNVRVAAAFLDGRASQELDTGDLDYHDPDYPLVVTARAVKQS